MKKAYLASKICFNVAAGLLGVSVLITVLLQNKQIVEFVGDFLGDKGSTEVINTGKAPIRHKTWYTSVQDVLNGNGDVAKAAESEGAVLLKNDNNALPLDNKTDKVSLFGVTAYDPLYSLDGAGEVKINEERQQFFYDEFEKAGLKMNTELANWYKSNSQYFREDYVDIYDNAGSSPNGKNAKLNGAPWDAIPDVKSLSEFNTGIFITGRITNEAIDIKPENVGGLGAKNSDYLTLTDNEISVLKGMKQLKSQGKLKKIIVLINQANPVQENLPQIFKEYDVDAAMWVGFPGSDGIRAVADLISGKISPSGGLSTTWYTNRNANPSTPYFANDINVIMQEGLYLGYKYAETRYEDYVLGQGNTSSYNYAENISYPFGYGKSYTTFKHEIQSLELDEDPAKNYNHKGEKLSKERLRKEGDDYILNVKVTNTGNFAAKEIVQVYGQKPYTASNIKNAVEKPSVELVGFEKTKKLKPGDSEVVKVKIDANKYFASWDSTAGKYILDEGEYYLAAARNSHEAINSILLKKQSKGTKIDASKMNSLYGQGNVSLVETVSVTKERSSSYEYWTKTGNKTSKLFDHIDPNKISGKSDYVQFMTRNDWGKSADDAKNQKISLIGNMGDGAKLHNAKDITAEGAKTHYPEIVEKLGNEYPKYGLNRDSNGIAGIQLADMIGVEYEDSQGATEESKAKWEEFLDQLTYEETIKLIGNGLRRTVSVESIGKPYTNDVNASNGISWMFDMSLRGGSGEREVGFAYHFDPGDREHNPTGYPCPGIIAATFNKELAYAVGQAVGEDGLWTGASGLYGFGLGLHRNPYHGRSGEYYSDDPFLAGIIGGYESKGAQSKGLYVYNKHFVLNDQETKRTSYNTWLTEQTMREVYLRPFELAIEVGDAMNVMNSFNNIGSGWSGNDYNLMTKCLREEFGMRGFAVTDYWRSGGMNLTYGLLAGTDLPDGIGAEGEMAKYGPTKGDFGWYGQAARQAARRILYTVANSNAMNFIGKDTQIIVHDPQWLSYIPYITIPINIFFGLSAIGVLTLGAWYHIAKLRNKGE